jgi:hypothetical protein
MEKLEHGRKFAGRLVTLLRKELSDFSQTDGRNKQKRKPRAAADISSNVAEKDPADAGNRENDDGGGAPAAISSTRAPRSRQNEQGRDYGEEKKNVIQIHHVDLSGE